MQQPLKEGVDFYFNKEGLMVFTGEFLKNRGYCCKSGCIHCPYGFKKPGEERDTVKNKGSN